MAFNFEEILAQPQDTFFGENLMMWYNEHKRDLPWRNTKNPYFIWLSEIILQQTRVNQGMPYYQKFVENYPKVEDLANAPIDEVLRLWQGLGYYARARNMHATAKMVVEQFNGTFPDNFLTLQQLKGVGHYTASAIASFAYHEAVAVLDGNVYRVLARYFGINDAINAPVSVKNFQKLAQKCLISNNPSIYNQAIMEFGALQCTPDNPNCMFCPLQTPCVAFQTQQQKTLPYKIPKKSVKERFFTYLVWKNIGKNSSENLDENVCFALRKRTKGDIWEGLYEFALVIQEKEEFEKDIFDLSFLAKLSPDEFVLKKNPTLHTHQLTHQKLFIRFFELETHFSLQTLTEILKDISTIQNLENLQFYTKNETENLPKPIILANYLKAI